MAAEDSADFEDDRAFLNKEARIRRRTLRIYNKRREEFASDREYDDYLEEIEDIILNLVNEIDVDATQKKVEKYRRENQDVIGQNQARRAEEERHTLGLLAHEERERVAKLAELRKIDAEIEEEAKRKRREEELEELQRVALGEKEAARLKRKKEKRERKERRKQEAADLAVAEARMKAAEIDTRPMFFRPNFPNPPPKPHYNSIVDGQEVSAASRAAAGGFKAEIAMQRARLEFDQCMLVLIKP